MRPTLRSSMLRLWLLKQVLNLPPAVLRFLSGGGVVYSRGRTLDPQIQFLWRSWFAGHDGPLLGLGEKPLEQAQQEWSETAALLGLPSQARVRIEDITSEKVRGLLIRPATIASDAPLLVFFHQGGGVLGGPDLSRAFCAAFAHEARCPVFLPQFRLAPVNRFPAALEDARMAFEWAQANAIRLGASSSEVAVGGILTGAGLAARLCVDLKRDFRPLPVAQLLVTPLIDLSDNGFKAEGLDTWPLAAADVDVMIGHYAGAGTDLTDPHMSPALEKLLVGQPKALVASAGLDPLAAQAEAFVKRLISAKGQAIYRRYDTLPLGFDLFTGVVDAAYTATRDMARLWVDLLRSNPSESGLSEQDAA